MHVFEEIAVVLNFAAKPAKWDDNNEDTVVVEFDDAVPQHLAAAVPVPLKFWHRLHVILFDPIELLGREAREVAIVPLLRRS